MIGPMGSMNALSHSLRHALSSVMRFARLAAPAPGRIRFFDEVRPFFFLRLDSEEGKESGYPRKFVRRLSQPRPISPAASTSQVAGSGVWYSSVRLLLVRISSQYLGRFKLAKSPV